MCNQTAWAKGPRGGTTQVYRPLQEGDGEGREQRKIEMDVKGKMLVIDSLQDLSKEVCKMMNRWKGIFLLDGEW